MTANCRCQGILVAAFEEVALALGGAVASYRLPDEAIWDLARTMDLACERARSRMGCHAPAEPDEAEPGVGVAHPAIAHLLSRLNEQQLGVGACAGHRGVRT